MNRSSWAALLCAFLVLALLLLTTCPRASAQGNVYRTYDDFKETLRELAEKAPHVLHVSTIGTSYEGREILLAVLSDKPELEEAGEAEVLLIGAHHAAELPSCESLLRFIEWSVEHYGKARVDNDGDGKADEDEFDGEDNDGDGAVDEDPSEERLTAVLDTRKIYIVPLLNPDGVNYYMSTNDWWRKNREPNYLIALNYPLPDCYGVDLNRNYGYNFWYPNLATSQNPYSDTYRGEEEFCELETRAVRDLVERSDFRIALSYHTYGGWVLYPWGWTKSAHEEPPDKELFVEIGENITKINGYELEQSGDLYRTSGDACDWLYGVHGILAYTIELDTGGYAPEDEALLRNVSWVHIGVNLYVAEAAGYLEKLAPLALPKAEPVYLGTLPELVVFMGLICGTIYTGFFRCIRLAMLAERTKYAARTLEE